jgi:resuscitation-promoting factor RpfC
LLICLLAVTPASASPIARPAGLPSAAGISLHPISHARVMVAALAAFYRVRRGDTLTSIAAREYGDPKAWPALWWVNRHRVANPNLIMVGEQLKLSAWHPVTGWLRGKALAAVPAPPVAVPAPVQAAPAAAPAPQPVAQPAIYGGAPGSFQACVIARESGGNASAVNPSSGAGGLYQFLPSTWAALGHSGLPENASVAEQNQAFQQEYAQSGTSAWAPYDGC